MKTVSARMLTLIVTLLSIPRPTSADHTGAGSLQHRCS